MPGGTQVKMDGFVITVKGGASQAGLPQASKPAALWSAKDHTREETALQGVGPRVRFSRQL